MQWYIKEAELRKATSPIYEFSRKYKSYKFQVTDFISEVRQIDEFLFKDAEKKLPKAKVKK